ncbi:restriction endonuclease subunit S [Pseudomonas aeruginosa]|uniref:restriction endonuclease subunit S n=1 Tax=Pseudomonas aeruginosa TaxID=287 RepID=UPI000BB83241|nr:restriction endonuclease subunit S [Pseudomonas aeruginosa]ELM5709116.1 restriction endonuclease subunit S [Pseudomonas aeruginosa]MCU8975588.1 restriction endonuclease subunit S [Pseudomonas aeruginosa]MCU8982729.1 restriction endonuclease subunit S [Pseudomonas aeruginosa]MCU8988143.1 restriction endonuclease subunit S [Pseudomonas aeruginosa]MCU8994372.1 restriction endonuclease subunit S [Pseudomonas aeruginosa]
MKLSDLIDFNPKRPIEKGAIAPFIEMADLPEGERDVAGIGSRVFNGSGSKFKNGDTLFARITPCLENGKTTKVSGLPGNAAGHGSTEFIVMSAKDPGVDEDFVYYVARHPEFRAYAQGRMEGTSGRQRVSWQAIADYTIPDFSSVERKNIGSVLSSIDNLIATNRRINETLEAMARTLFKAWFVDFEPVRAKLDGRWQPGQSLPGLPAQLYDLFPDRLVDSDLGVTPEGWERVSASRLIEFNPSESLRKGTEAPYIEMAALPTSGCWPELPVARPFGSGMRFRNGDTLLARITPCLENGKTAFVQCLPDDTVGWGSTEYIVMRPKAPVPSEFGYLLARDAAFRELAIRSMTGTSGRQRVQADSVAAFKIAAPSNDGVWDAFSRVVVTPFKSIKANAEAIATLSQLRDTVLPKLISGELRILDAERIVGAAI